MLSATPLFRSAATFARVNIRRNFGASYALLKPAAAATDPIQKLFADKVSNVTLFFSFKRTCQSIFVFGFTTIDPKIQFMYLFQTKEYAQKKQASGGKLVDATKEVETALQEELDKVAQSYGGGAGVDMKAFPSFQHKDPVIDKE